MGYNCENGTLTFTKGLPDRTPLASQVALGIELDTSCMRGRCSDNRATGTDVMMTVLGCIYAICVYMWVNNG